MALRAARTLRVAFVGMVLGASRAGIKAQTPLRNVASQATRMASQPAKQESDWHTDLARMGALTTKLLAEEKM